MGRVDDDGRGLGNFLHHVAARQITLNTADPALDLGIAFGFFELVPDLLLGHAQRFVMPPVSSQKIEAANDQKQKGRFPQEIFKRATDHHERWPDAHASQTRVSCQVRPGDGVNGQSHEWQEYKSLQERSPVLPRNVPDLLERVQSLQVGR
jgi:hypothetical protein